MRLLTTLIFSEESSKATAAHAFRPVKEGLSTSLPVVRQSKTGAEPLITQLWYPLPVC